MVMDFSKYPKNFPVAPVAVGCTHAPLPGLLAPLRGPPVTITSLLHHTASLKSWAHALCRENFPSPPVNDSTMDRLWSELRFAGLPTSQPLTNQVLNHPDPFLVSLIEDDSGP